MFIQDLATLQAQIATLVAAQTETQRTLAALKNNRAFNIEPAVQLTPCSSGITNESQINLEVFKTLPIFDGDKKKYRAWRSSAWTHMETIKNFENTPTYYTALAIVRAKIQGVAADILINHNTIFNFYSIINRLDYTYADQRPMYVLLEEMKKITQGRRELAVYHSAMNEALNLILSKIEMEKGDETMKSFANQEAVRAFITGLNSKYTIGTLYAQNPRDLETAYAIASTIYHDDKHLQFDSPSHRPHPMSQQHNQQKPRHQQFEQRKYRPNVQYNPNQQLPYIQRQPPVQPMEVDTSDRNVRQSTQFQRYNNPFRQNQPFKREFNYSNNNFNPNKQQRINNTKEEDEANSTRAEYDEDEDTKVAFLD